MDTSLFMAVNPFFLWPVADVAVNRPAGNVSAQDMFLRPKTALNRGSAEFPDSARVLSRPGELTLESLLWQPSLPPAPVLGRRPHRTLHYYLSFVSGINILFGGARPGGL